MKMREKGKRVLSIGPHGAGPCILVMAFCDPGLPFFSPFAEESNRNLPRGQESKAEYRDHDLMEQSEKDVEHEGTCGVRGGWGSGRVQMMEGLVYHFKALDSFEGQKDIFEGLNRGVT